MSTGGSGVLKGEGRSVGTEKNELSADNAAKSAVSSTGGGGRERGTGDGDDADVSNDDVIGGGSGRAGGRDDVIVAVGRAWNTSGGGSEIPVVVPATTSDEAVRDLPGVGWLTRGGA
jgi:hypothetical protein